MKEKLLVLDDERLILTSLEHLFEDEYEVLTATTAETALGLARKHDIAVTLCDERMPGVTGHEFLRRLREISRSTRVMMSGYADMSALAEAVNRAGIFAYVTKPWEPLKLRATVAAATVHFKLVQEVEEGRELLNALMENIPDQISFKDCHARFTRVNQAHAQALGANNSAECIGKSDADYFEPADVFRWRQEEDEIIRSGEPQIDKVEQLKTHHAGRRWMSTTKVPMFDRSSQVSGIASVSRDITALKNTEEMLLDQSERNRMIIETANEPFIGMQPDGTITAWNPQAELTFGWAAAEVLGRRLCDTVVAPACRDAHANGVEEFLTTANGLAVNRAVELVAVHRDGHEFPVEATVWPVRVAGACSFNAFVRDISERRNAEDDRKKETRLVQLLQCVTVTANRSSTIEDTAVTCLEQICSHLGWPVGHVYLRDNSSPEMLISSGFWQDKADDAFAAFHESSRHFHLGSSTELPDCVLASGKPKWIVNLGAQEPLSERAFAAARAGLRSGFGFPIVVDAKVVGVMEFFSDQTIQPADNFLNMMEHIGFELGQVIRRQRTEEELRRAKASAEFANRAKSEFLTTMSHEMRTPMNAILGMADLLSESSLSEEQQDYVRIFQRAGANLLTLINDILDLSKVESGHLELESVAFDLRSLLERIIEMMATRARDRGLQLTLQVQPGVPIGLVGDPHRLRQILVNLIGNALKFTEQGSVTLLVQQEPDGAAGWLRFNVVDTGIGIAADKIEVIFDRFTQADSSTTRKYGGTGLGLAISAGLVQLMGGRIGCRSGQNKGSTFFVSAPFAIGSLVETSDTAGPAAGEILETRPPVQQPAFRILIAEDSEDNLVLIRAYLKGSGLELEVAENGKVAVEKVMLRPPHLVLMDMQMPVMDGLDATRTIRRWEKETNSRPIPILALTAHAGEEGMARSREAGCTEHLTKPIKKATLVEAIARHLGRKIHITPPKDVESLVPRYLANVRRDMGKILAGIDSQDCETARRLGHHFKGSGTGYGFPEITRAGAAVEAAALLADETEIRSQIVVLANYLDRVEIVVQDRG